MRLFGNVLGAFVIMELLKLVVKSLALWSELWSKPNAKEIGFGVVVSVKQKYFEKIRKEICPEFDFGMILILHHRNIIAQYSYRSYQKEIETFHQTLRKEIHVLPKRSTYSFGSIKFISEARLAELQDKNESNLSNQEKIELLLMENAELKRQLHEEQNRPRLRRQPVRHKNQSHHQRRHPSRHRGRLLYHGGQGPRGRSRLSGTQAEPRKRPAPSGPESNQKPPPCHSGTLS